MLPSLKLQQIAKDQGYNLLEINTIWDSLPIEDREELTYLESAGTCILEVSRLVDDTYPNLEYKKRIAKKFKLMAELLNLKAEELEVRY